mgnify:CR=1 FL=1
MTPKINVFESADALVSDFSTFFFRKANKRIQENKTFTVALSGGSTPNTFYKHIADNYKNATEWNHIHFFWGDERMVPASEEQSNFGTARRIFLDTIDINPENIHPIRGEADVDNEAARYSCEITSYVHESGSLPSFDLIILGLGDDGHTASVFPNQMDLMYSNRVCEIAEHPKTGQQRITLSGKTINNARNIVFLVTGENKADIVHSVVNKSNNYNKFPAAHIEPDSGKIYWFLDAKAGKNISV